LCQAFIHHRDTEDAEDTEVRCHNETARQREERERLRQKTQRRCRTQMPRAECRPPRSLLHASKINRLYRIVEFGAGVHRRDVAGLLALDPICDPLHHHRLDPVKAVRRQRFAWLRIESAALDEHHFLSRRAG